MFESQLDARHYCLFLALLPTSTHLGGKKDIGRTVMWSVTKKRKQKENSNGSYLEHQISYVTAFKMVKCVDD